MADIVTGYHPLLALTVLSGVFLALGALCAIIVAADIVWRRGWRSMMWIMIPVYVINATYMLPVSLWVYFKYGRPAIPSRTITESKSSGCHTVNTTAVVHAASDSATAPHQSCMTRDGDPPQRDASELRGLEITDSDAEKGADAGEPHCHHHAESRPMYATILVGVSHCGAGCVLGDIVGEWLVYGTNATIHGQMIWVELLVDYAFALLFGIVFQYFSIAPMAGEYGPKIVWRAVKADVLSLTSFEVGAFGWMVACQVGIFGYRLSMSSWTYWWMMQIGMFLGFWTAVPVNWWLIRRGIKEPCA